MCETLATVVLRGELDRDLAGRFFRDAFMELRPQVRSFVWQGWQSTIAMLGLSELRILVKRAFDRGFIDPHWIGFDGFLRDLEWAIKRPGEGRYPHDNEFTLFGDTVEELSRWDGFSEECLAGRDQGLDRPRLTSPITSPIGIHSEGLAATILVLAAAARSSRIAVSVDDAGLEC